MTEERQPRVIITLSDEMFAAGVEELMKYLPGKDDPAVAVARIYGAIEFARMMHRADLSPETDKHLN